MAKMLSHVGSVIRGSVAGLTYTANQYASIVMRARVSPVQPNTNYQEWMRASSVTAEAQWKALTEAQKRNWQTFANTVSFSGPTGPYTVNARALFFGWVATRLYLSIRGSIFTTPVYTCPVTPGRIPSIGGSALIAPTTGVGIQCSFTNQAIVAVNAIGVVSQPFSNSRNTWKGPFISESIVFDDAVAAAGGGTIEFTNLVLGSTYFLRILLVSNTGPCNVSLATILRFKALSSADHTAKSKAK